VVNGFLDLHLAAYILTLDEASCTLSGYTSVKAEKNCSRSAENHNTVHEGGGEKKLFCHMSINTFSDAQFA